MHFTGRSFRGLCLQPDRVAVGTSVGWPILTRFTPAAHSIYFIWEPIVRASSASAWHNRTTESIGQSSDPIRFWSSASPEHSMRTVWASRPYGPPMGIIGCSILAATAMNIAASALPVPATACAGSASGMPRSLRVRRPGMPKWSATRRWNSTAARSASGSAEAISHVLTSGCMARSVWLCWRWLRQRNEPPCVARLPARPLVRFLFRFQHFGDLFAKLFRILHRTLGRLEIGIGCPKKYLGRPYLACPQFFKRLFRIAFGLRIPAVYELRHAALLFDGRALLCDLVNQVGDPAFRRIQIPHALPEKFGKHRGNAVTKLFLSLLKKRQIGIAKINCFVRHSISIHATHMYMQGAVSRVFRVGNV